MTAMEYNETFPTAKAKILWKRCHIAQSILVSKAKLRMAMANFREVSIAKMLQERDQIDKVQL